MAKKFSEMPMPMSKKAKKPEAEMEEMDLFGEEEKPSEMDGEDKGDDMDLFAEEESEETPEQEAMELESVSDEDLKKELEKRGFMVSAK